MLIANILVISRFLSAPWLHFGEINLNFRFPILIFIRTKFGIIDKKKIKIKVGLFIYKRGYVLQPKRQDIPNVLIEMLSNKLASIYSCVLAY